MDEKYIQGWGVVAYNYNGLICHLKLQDLSVELAFYKGTGLNDPTGITKIKGKQRRVLALLEGDEIPEELLPLLQEAFR